MSDFPAQLKTLRVRQDRLLRELSLLKDWRGQLDAAIYRIEGKLDKVKREIEAVVVQSGGIIPSEHAMLRYLERFCGIDMDKVQKEILLLPANRIEVVNSVVVTVLGEEKH